MILKSVVVDAQKALAKGGPEFCVAMIGYCDGRLHRPMQPIKGFNLSYLAGYTDAVNLEKETNELLLDG